jgi:predicted DNA-binding protein
VRVAKPTEMAKRATAGGGGSVPVSVVLPAELKRRLRAEAKKRGLKLSPAVRVLLGERLHDLDEVERLSRAEEWQRAEAWSAWERLKAGQHEEVSRAEIDAEFDAARGRSAARLIPPASPRSA